jgi:hypothetical protein
MVVDVVSFVRKGQEPHHVQDVYVMTHARMGQMVAIAKGANVIAP